MFIEGDLVLDVYRVKIFFVVELKMNFVLLSLIMLVLC